MKKMILTPAIVMLAALSACSSGGDAPATDGAETTGEVAEEAAAPAANAAPAADADSDAADPKDDADDHAHGDGEGEHADH